MHGFDFRVTLRARCRDIFSRNRRRRVGVRQNRVRGMARRAVRRNNQAFPQQAFAVNALGKILDDVVLVDFSLLRDFRSFLMTFATEERNLQRRNLRLRILGGENVMSAVTVFARRRKRVAAFDGFAVQRLRV